MGGCVVYHKHQTVTKGARPNRKPLLQQGWGGVGWGRVREDWLDLQKRGNASPFCATWPASRSSGLVKKDVEQPIHLRLPSLPTTCTKFLFRSRYSCMVAGGWAPRVHGRRCCTARPQSRHHGEHGPQPRIFSIALRSAPTLRTVCSVSVVSPSSQGRHTEPLAIAFKSAPTPGASNSLSKLSLVSFIPAITPHLSAASECKATPSLRLALDKHKCSMDCFSSGNPSSMSVSTSGQSADRPTRSEMDALALSWRYNSIARVRKGLIAIVPVSSVSTFKARLAAWNKGTHRQRQANGRGTITISVSSKGLVRRGARLWRSMSAW